MESNWIKQAKAKGSAGQHGKIHHKYIFNQQIKQG
jgi:hypothetical protein